MKAYKPLFSIFILFSILLGTSQCVVQDRQEEVDFSRSTIVQDILDNPQLSVLAAAMTHSRILATLEIPESVTFLAPDDEVMNSLIDTILSTDTSWVTLTDIPHNTLRKRLERIFDYHTIPGQNILTSDLTNGQVVITSFGLGLTVFKSQQLVQFTRVDNGRTTDIVVPDLVEKNGVIHIVNKLLEE